MITVTRICTNCRKKISVNGSIRCIKFLNQPAEGMQIRYHGMQGTCDYFERVPNTSTLT